jgi:DNA-binding beta-propeller fold protein YncE
MAYCDGRSGDITVVDPADDPAVETISGGERAARGCPLLSWNPAGQLTFISRSSSDDSQILSTYDGSTLVSAVTLPLDAPASYVAWASPNEIAVETLRRTAIVDLTTSATVRWIDGILPSYSPELKSGSARLIAVLARNADGDAIEVYADDDLVARTPVSEQGVAFAWSPDGRYIAVVDPGGLRVWDWANQVLTTLVSVDTDSEMLLPVLAWLAGPP